MTSSTRETEDKMHDRVLAWLGYWRDEMPPEAVKQLQQICSDARSPKDSELREALVEAREEMRLLMLEQPITGERRTYNDGFASGLAHAIATIDAALNKQESGND